MHSANVVRSTIVTFLVFAHAMLAQTSVTRADFTWTIIPDDPKIVDEGTFADITFTIKIMTTDESILVSKISPNYMFDSGPDQTDIGAPGSESPNSAVHQTSRWVTNTTCAADCLETVGTSGHRSSSEKVRRPITPSMRIGSASIRGLSGGFRCSFANAGL